MSDQIKLPFFIEVTREPDDDMEGAYTYGYVATAHPKAVMAYMQKVTMEAIEQMFPDGDNAHYVLRWELDDPYNPACHFLAYDHDADGPFLAGASAYVQVGINI